MITILHQWRQFSRRYFWPHLLLGMVAASLGLPCAHALSAEKNSQPATAASKLMSGPVVHLDALAQLQDSRQQATSAVDYWHQHAIRTVIRHLSFTLSPQHLPDAGAVAPLRVQKLALIDTLSVLLTHELRRPVIMRATEEHHAIGQAEYQTGLWLAQVQGIRAGPHILA